MLLNLWNETLNETVFVERLLAIMVECSGLTVVTGGHFEQVCSLMIRRQDVINDDVSRFLVGLQQVMGQLRSIQPGRHYVVSGSAGYMSGSIVAEFSFGVLPSVP